ncbi:MAG: bifunctional SulP family inorganic anion transporter/carbonic anhydrase [Planctomycetaceae bacterium]|nr:bifunctional SulP family inorganic anion transporter/carbonic anhydrase [Planctomycetaceae bacterium]
MPDSMKLSSTLPRDLVAGVIVFLVALPLCLGIALASGAPLFSGLIAGIVGGIVVGSLSGSSTSVSGPAAGLTAVVASQIATLGSFEAFLLAVSLAGVIQVILGCARAGALSAFFPSSVIKGLLAAIGVILLIKQTPYLLGYDMTPKAPSHGHTSIVTQIEKIFTGEIHWGALTIGLISMALLIVSDKIKALKNSLVPAPLLVVLLGVGVGILFQRLGSPWILADGPRLMVNVPVTESISSFKNLLVLPDFSQWANPNIYVAALTLAIVASLETLLNLDAVDKLDKFQRLSPPNRELFAQGAGNIACGLLGGLPVTSVIIRGSVNVNSGARTKLSTIFHGLLLFSCVLLIPAYLNMIPLSCLAAILLMTGYKLASPKLFQNMWRDGLSQFLPFISTLVAIVATDLLIGIVIGMVVSLLFILKSNLSQPIRQVNERHVSGTVRRIELANQVSFLNKASLEKALRNIPDGGDAILDARNTDYIDPDVLGFIREFKEVTAPAHDIRLRLQGFRERYQLADEVQFVDFSPREKRADLKPNDVLRILKEGNERFCSGQGLDRTLQNYIHAEKNQLQPLAIVFSGVDSRVPAELLFDLSLGELITIRLGGNVIGPRVLGSLEYGCMVGGAKLILVMGHVNSGMVKLAIEQAINKKGNIGDPPSLNGILSEIQQSLQPEELASLRNGDDSAMARLVDVVVRRNVQHTALQIVSQSPVIKRLVQDDKVAIVCSIFNSENGRVETF